MFLQDIFFTNLLSNVRACWVELRGCEKLTFSCSMISRRHRSTFSRLTSRALVKKEIKIFLSSTFLKKTSVVKLNIHFASKIII